MLVDVVSTFLSHSTMQARIPRSCSSSFSLSVWATTIQFGPSFGRGRRCRRWISHIRSIPPMPPSRARRFPRSQPGSRHQLDTGLTAQDNHTIQRVADQGRVGRRLGYSALVSPTSAAHRSALRAVPGSVPPGAPIDPVTRQLASSPPPSGICLLDLRTNSAFGVVITADWLDVRGQNRQPGLRPVLISSRIGRTASMPLASRVLRVSRSR